MNGNFVQNKLSRFAILVVTTSFIVLLRLILIKDREPVFDTFDSQYYFDFRIFNSFRLPVIAGIYSLLENYDYIVIFQNITASISWILFSLSATLLVKRSIAKYLIFGLIIGLSTTQLAIFRDVYLLSESLTLSTFLLVSSSIILVAHKLTNRNVFFLFVSLILFSGVKSTNTLAVFVFGIVFLPFLINYLIKNNFNYRFVVSFFIFLFPFILFLQSSLSSDVTAQLNTSAHINSRLWIEESWKSQLLETNYPPELRTIWKDRYDYNLGETPDQGVVNERIFQQWWQDDGNKFLLNFMLKNPDYTFFGPIGLPLISEKANFSHTLIHSWSQDPRFFSLENINYNIFEFLWPKNRNVAYLFTGLQFIFLSFALILTLNNKKYFRDFVVVSLLATFYLIWSYISWWFGSKPGSDILRHQESPALLFRAIGIISIILIFEKFISSQQFSKHKSNHKTGRYLSRSH